MLSVHPRVHQGKHIQKAMIIQTSLPNNSPRWRPLLYGEHLRAPRKTKNQGGDRNLKNEQKLK